MSAITCTSCSTVNAVPAGADLACDVDRERIEVIDLHIDLRNDEALITWAFWSSEGPPIVTRCWLEQEDDYWHAHAYGDVPAGVLSKVREAAALKQAERDEDAYDVEMSMRCSERMDALRGML